MEKNGLRMNFRKTKIMVSGINMGLPNKSRMDPCSVLQTGVGKGRPIDGKRARDEGCFQTASDSP